MIATVALTGVQEQEVRHLLGVRQDSIVNGEDPDGVVWGEIEGMSLLLIDAAEAHEDVTRAALDGPEPAAMRALARAIERATTRDAG